MSHDLTWILEALREVSASGGDDPQVARELPASIIEGSRNESLASLAGTMRRRGMDQEVIEVALLAHNSRHCSPPLDNDEVMAIARSIARYDPREIGTIDEVLTWGDPPLGTETGLTADSARVDAYVDNDPPEVEMLIHDLLPARVVGMIAGTGGVGKTSMMMEMAVAMASGRSVFGHWAPVRPLKGAILIKEDDSEDLHRMLHRAVRAPIVQPTDALGASIHNVGDAAALRAIVKQNLRAKSLIGRSTVVVEQEGKRAMISRWYAELVAYLERLSDDMGGLDFVMLDPMRRFSNADENDSNAANMLIEAFDRIRDRLGCTVLTTHHLHKGGDVTKAYASRGSSALEDGGRFVLNVGPINEEKELHSLGLHAEDGWNRYLKLVNVKNTKVRRASQLVIERTQDQTFEAVGTYAALRDGQRVGVGKAQSNYDQLLPDILQLVLECPGQYTSRALAAEMGGVDGPLGAGRDTVRECCLAAIERGDIELQQRKNAYNRMTDYMCPPGWSGWDEEETGEDE